GGERASRAPAERFSEPRHSPRGSPESRQVFQEVLMTTATVETLQFQAETRQLLDIMIHSLYSNKEIFLRELISNASDALDRLRFESLTRPELLEGDEKLEIRLEADRQARTLTIHDNGIGMNREEVIANIRTIAKSGPRQLVEPI